MCCELKRRKGEEEEKGLAEGRREGETSGGREAAKGPAPTQVEEEGRGRINAVLLRCIYPPLSLVSSPSLLSRLCDPAIQGNLSPFKITLSGQMSRKKNRFSLQKRVHKSKHLRIAHPSLFFSAPSQDIFLSGGRLAEIGFKDPVQWLLHALAPAAAAG